MFLAVVESYEVTTTELLADLFVKEINVFY